MKDKRPALGKGLAALFPSSAAPAGDRPSVLECPVDRIDALPDQPRRRFKDEALAELAASIRESGVLQPLLVTRDGERYRLIAGERRLRAAKLAGLSAVSAFFLLPMCPAISPGYPASFGSSGLVGRTSSYWYILPSSPMYRLASPKAWAASVKASPVAG